MRDPITDLVGALEQHGRPPLAWVVRWSGDGAEPVAAAWARSADPSAMARLLSRAGHPLATRAHAVVRAPVLFAHSDLDRVRADAIRALVPTPPPLIALLVSHPGRLGFLAVDAHATRARATALPPR